MISGLAYRYKLLADGRRQIVGFVLPGDLVCSGALLSSAFGHTVRLMRSSVVATIGLDDFLAQHPTLVRCLWALSCTDQAIAWQWLATIGQQTARARVAHLFCELYHRLRHVGGVEDDSFAFPASQQEIGDSVGIVGITIVHANRVLQGLRSDGLIAFDGKAVYVRASSGWRRSRHSSAPISASAPEGMRGSSTSARRAACARVGGPGPARQAGAAHMSIFGLSRSIVS